MMPSLAAVAGALVAGVGLVAIVLALHARGATASAADWLAADLASVDPTQRSTGGGSPLARAVRPFVDRLARTVGGLTPKAHLDRLHDDLLHAGLAGRLRAEELLALNVLTAVAAVAAASTWLVAAAPPGRLAIAGVAAVSVAGVVVPRAWLARKVAARKEAIFRDLPDALDLMVIGMEAGVTFDGALQVVAEHLDSPLGQELGHTLAEMELGLARRGALQNLRRRTAVPEVANVVVALLQADALGMSVSRVLRVQAAEMRAKRRQWAREKAAKLPVKILFPLVAFIFPPVLVVILGPAFADIRSLFP